MWSVKTMKKIKAAIIGYGNIGRYVFNALQEAPDFKLAGVIKRYIFRSQKIPLRT